MAKNRFNFASHFTDIAAQFRQALLDEVRLTPKPGLVDFANSGAHHDMDYALFLRSIDAISPWFLQFLTLGYETAMTPTADLLKVIRPLGIACEKRMFEITQGVNTHKGAIFSLGLLATAIGRAFALNEPVTRLTVCHIVQQIAYDLVQRELMTHNQVMTAGERLYRDFGLTGVRGEVASGFQTVFQTILPYWDRSLPLEHSLHEALLRLMAVNQDTNLVARGGLTGLHYVQRYAQQLLLEGWDIAKLSVMDQQLTVLNLSPGGSADLLSVAQILLLLPE